MIFQALRAETALLVEDLAKLCRMRSLVNNIGGSAWDGAVLVGLAT